MLKKSLMLLAVAAVSLCFFGPAAFSQEDMKNVPNEVFGAPRRPAAVFPHDAHNEKAQIEDCAVCHHGGKDGKMDKEDMTAGTACVECHPVAGAPGQTSLMRAFHKQCVGCHLERKAGPVACGQCHVNK